MPDAVGPSVRVHAARNENRIPFRCYSFFNFCVPRAQRLAVWLRLQSLVRCLLSFCAFFVSFAQRVINSKKWCSSHKYVKQKHISSDDDYVAAVCVRVCVQREQLFQFNLCVSIARVYSFLFDRNLH